MLHKKLYCDGLKWRLEETQLKIRPCHCPGRVNKRLHSLELILNLIRHISRRSKFYINFHRVAS